MLTKLCQHFQSAFKWLRANNINIKSHDIVRQGIVTPGWPTFVSHTVCGRKLNIYKRSLNTKHKPVDITLGSAAIFLPAVIFPMIHSVRDGTPGFPLLISHQLQSNSSAAARKYLPSVQRSCASAVTRAVPVDQRVFSGFLSSFWVYQGFENFVSHFQRSLFIYSPSNYRQVYMQLMSVQSKSLSE